MNPAFDTLAYAKKLKEAGFTETQAEAQAEALRAVVDSNLATKQDLKELESRITSAMRSWWSVDLRRSRLAFEGADVADG